MDIYLNEIVRYLITQSWQIAALTVAVAAATFALRRHSAHARYLLWLVVLAKCLVPPLQVVPLRILPPPQPNAGNAAFSQQAGWAEPGNGASPALFDTSDSLSGRPVPGVQAFRLHEHRLSTLGVLGFLWAIGAGAYLAMNLLRALRGHYRLRRSRLALPDDIQAEAQSLLPRRGMTRLPTIWMVEDIGQPFVWGLVRGNIYVPLGFLAVRNPEQRRDILAHELSHVLRLDAGVNTLQVLAQGFFWFHPLVWWANCRIRREREECCDEMVIAWMGTQPRAYSRALVEALRVAREVERLAPSLAIAGPARNIEERIKTLLQPGRRFHQRPSLWAAACALLLALLVVPTTLALTSRPADPTKTAGPQVAAESPIEPNGAQRTLSADNLRKLGLAVIMYAMDHEGKYPDDLLSLLGGYIAGDDADRFAPFISNDAEYLGTSKTRRENQAFDTPLAYDLTLLRGGTGTNVVFADGHVAFVSGTQLDKYGIALPKSHLEILKIQFEPVHQGKNVVHVTVKNASEAEQVFAAHIYTRSPDYGRPSPNPAESGVGWGTGGYSETLRPGETKPLRLVFKIQGLITDRTYVILRFYNPPAPDKYEYKRYFLRRTYTSADLEKVPTEQVPRVAAAPGEAQAVIQAFTEIQSELRDSKYEQVWEHFTKDYQKAEYQVGFEWFRRAMEPTHPMQSAFTWERGDFLKLKPGPVFRRSGVLTLAAALDGQTWNIDFVRDGDQWKIDWIAGYVPAIIRMEERAPAPAGGSGNLTMPQEKPGTPLEKTDNLRVLDAQFVPIHQGKNVVRIKAENRTGQDQALVVHIQTRSPEYGPSGIGWGTAFTDTIPAGKTKECRFVFCIQGPIVDTTSVRLRYYSPGPAAGFDADQWYKTNPWNRRFEERTYFGRELPRQEASPQPPSLATASQRVAIFAAFQTIQGYVNDGKYGDAWKSFTKDHQDAGFNQRFAVFEESLKETRGPNRFGWLRKEFLDLQPQSVTASDGVLVLTAVRDREKWTIDFIQHQGQWKMDWIAGYTPRFLRTANWEEEVLPKMEKRRTAHFDIYYMENSTAAREIDRLASQKDRGFEQICQFLEQTSSTRIRLVLFEDGRTKQEATGHQGAGWAYGNTIVEVYNEKEKLDPYHETAHILTGSLGRPPALFNEGFAVYMSERLGAPALQSLSGGRATIYQRAGELKNKGEWIELRELLGYTEIGSAKSQPPIAYPEAASFVKFLIDTHGKDQFLQAYKALRNSSEANVRAENITKLEDLCGQPLQTLQQQWEAALAKS